MEQVLRLCREPYFDFTVKHCVEKLHAEHQIVLSYTWVKTARQTVGLLRRALKWGSAAPAAVARDAAAHPRQPPPLR